jgi:hypothetical protein
MSARSRAAPWFGTPGERAFAERERERMALRMTNADPFSDGTTRGRISYPPEAADAEVGTIRYAGTHHFRAPGWGLA